MFKPSRMLLVLIAALALVAAGCGDDNKENNAYVDQINKAQTAFNVKAKQLSDTGFTQSSTTAEDKATLVRYGAAVDAFVASLKKIPPPALVKPEHEQMIAAMQELSAKVKAARTQVSSGTPQGRAKAIIALNATNNAVGTQLNTAGEQINAKLKQK